MVLLVVNRMSMPGYGTSNAPTNTFERSEGVTEPSSFCNGVIHMVLLTGAAGAVALAMLGLMFLFALSDNAQDYS